MALMYPTGKKAILDADVDLLVDSIKAVLLLTAYAPVSTDQFLSDVAGANRIGTPQAIGTKSTTGGVFDGASVVFPAVGAAGACDKVLIYKDTGVAGTSALIAVIDLAAGVTPNGGDITINWSTSASKIFRLV